MAKKTLFDRMKQLEEEIKHHSWQYHVNNTQEIPNDVFDEKQREFNDLCEEHPELAVKLETPTLPVPISEPTGTGLAVVKFAEPMLSLKKGFGMEDVNKFLESFAPSTTFVYEAKLDGLALELKYIKGILISMTTRGSGMVGEDVTHALPLFIETYLPRTIDTDLEELYIRGEGYIPIDSFNKYNEMVEEKKSNPRNAVSGWVRASIENQDQRVLDTLVFAAYWSSDTLGCENYEQLREVLKSKHFMTPPLSSLERVKGNLRGELVPTDGVVIKVNSFAEQKKVGSTSRHPRYALAYKFPNEETTSLFIDVEWNTSRFGRVVPVGIYSPIVLGGVVCTRASLDNYSNFMEMGLSAGDLVSVTRNNDVIPRINEIVEPCTTDGTKLLEAPTECPSCSSLLTLRIGKKGSDLICNNFSGCPGQLVARCVNLTNKFAYDIDDLGPIAIADLVDRGLVKIPADIFCLGNLAHSLLRPAALVNIQLAKSGSKPLNRFLKGLGLPDIGMVLAKRITNQIVGSDEAFSPEMLERNLKDVRFLTSVKGISSGIAMKVVNAFNDPTFEENFQVLASVIEINPIPVPTDEYKVVVTGTFDQSREELVSFFANHGIELTERVTKDCKYMIAGDRPGKGKLLKGTELGITMLQASDYTSIDNLINFIKDHSA